MEIILNCETRVSAVWQSEQQQQQQQQTSKAAITWYTSIQCVQSVNLTHRGRLASVAVLFLPLLADQRWNLGAFKILSLKPHSEVAWSTWEHILLAVYTHVCPGPHGRTAYSTDMLCETRRGRRSHNMQNGSRSVWFNVCHICGLSYSANVSSRCLSTHWWYSGLSQWLALLKQTDSKLLSEEKQ